jgi:hypothetical protein
VYRNDTGNEIYQEYKENNEMKKMKDIKEK